MSLRNYKEHHNPLPFILIYIVLSVGLILVGFFHHGRMMTETRYEAEQQLRSIGDLKVHSILDYRNERLGDAAVIYKNSVFSTLMRRHLLLSSDSDTSTQLRAWLRSIRGAYNYDMLMLMDAYNNVIMTEPESSEQVASHISEENLASLRSGMIVFEDFYINEQDQRIYLKILVPILDETDNNRFMGILALRIDPETHLYPFISTWPTPSQTAETLLVRRDGDDVLFLNELKFQSGTALTVRKPLSDTRLPASMAVLGQEGIVEGIDYRGVPVIAYVHAIPDTPWYLVAREDKSEIYAPMRERLWTTAAFIAILLIGLALFLVIIWKQQHIRTYRERLKATEQLKESEAKLSITLDSIGDAVIATDLEGGIERMNPVAESLTGCKLSESRGRPLSDVFHIIDSQTGDASSDPVRQVLDTGNVVELANHTLLVSHDGSEYQIFDSAAPIRDTSGKTYGVVLVFRDVTERYKMIESLRQSEILLKATQSLTRTGGWEWNKDTGRIFWTDETYRIHGCTPEDVGLDLPEHVGKSLECYDPDDRPRVLSAFNRCCEVGEAYDLEFPFTNFAGKRMWVRTTARPDYEDGRIVKVVGSITDITERKAAEAERLEIIRELEAKNTELERFTYTASHDLKSPIITVKGYIGIVKQDIETGNSEQAEADLSRIEHAADKMLVLLDDLLQLSRIGRIVNLPVAVSLTDIVNSAVEQVEGEVRSRGVRVAVAENMPVVEVDKQRFTEVMQNLIENAVKFMGDQPDPLIEIGCLMEYDQAVIFVRDNGIGIESRFHEKIFGIFDKLNPEIYGTGIGLAIVKRVIGMHGGRIWVESGGLGKGSTFKFTLPIRNKVPEDHGDKNER